MHTHRLDLLSLTFGIVLAAITALLGITVWTDVTLDLGVVLPVTLICAGALALVIALVPRGRPDDSAGG